MMEARLRCTANSKQRHKRCLNPPTRGATTCRFHGSAAPQTKRATARRLAETTTRQVVSVVLNRKKFAGRDPSAVLIDQLQQAESTASAYAMRIDRIDKGLDPGEQRDALVGLWNNERDRIVKLGGDIVRLKVEERLARVEESKVDAVENAIRQALLDPRVNLTREQSQTFLRVLGDELEKTG